VVAQNVEPERLMSGLAERKLAEQAARLKTDDRVTMYGALIAAKPENPRYRNLLAATYIQKTRETTDYSYLDRAAKMIDGVLAGDGSNYEALRLRSEIELERHNFKNVAENSGKLTLAAPNDPWNWGTLGDALTEIGDYEGAAEAYQKMINLRPDLSSYNRAAYFRFLFGDMNGAIELMQKAISAGSTSNEHMAWCLVELGQMYFRTGKIEESGKAFEAALRIFPGYHPAFAGLGRTQAARGELKSAIESYRRAQAATPLPDYAAALYQLYDAAGSRVEADKQRELISVIDKMGQAAQEKTNRNLAMIYADNGWNLDRALELARAELDSRGDIYTYDALAWALYKNGRHTEAEKAADKALRLGTPDPQIHYHAGLIAVALGKKTEAAKHLKKALELNPRFDFRQSTIAEKALKELL
jgi:tetratricopeptide (TPR) repeat protein